MVAPMNPVSFGIREDFTRTIRASNFETPENVNRDVNMLRMLLLLHPPGRTLSAYLYYQNTIDIFENNLGIYPDRIAHVFGLHPTLQLFPRTQVYPHIPQPLRHSTMGVRQSHDSGCVQPSFRSGLLTPSLS